jgi:hypothetical protein
MLVLIFSRKFLNAKIGIITARRHQTFPEAEAVVMTSTGLSRIGLTFLEQSKMTAVSLKSKMKDSLN